MVIAIPMYAVTEFELGAVCAGSDASRPLLIAFASATVLIGLNTSESFKLIETFRVITYRGGRCDLHVGQVALKRRRERRSVCERGVQHYTE